MDESKLNEDDIKLIISLSTAKNDIDKYLILLKKDYGYNLSKQNLAQVLNKSEQTIDRGIKEGCNVPQYIRSSEGKKASYIFPIHEVAEYLCDTIEIF